MSTPVCRVCLTGNLRMTSVEDIALQNIFEKLTSLKVSEYLANSVLLENLDYVYKYYVRRQVSRQVCRVCPRRKQNNKKNKKEKKDESKAQFFFVCVIVSASLEKVPLQRSSAISNDYLLFLFSLVPTYLVVFSHL